MAKAVQPNKHEAPKSFTAALLFIIAIMIILSGVLFYKATTYASEAVNQAFSSAKASYQESKEKSKQDAHAAFSAKAKEQFKVQVHSNISITSVKETANLNVLECQTSDYFYREIPDQKITACLKVTGNGKYTINLKNAEYCVDQERSAVYIRLPQPIFEYTGETDEESVFFDKESLKIGPFDFGNGNTKQGSDILDALRAEASEKLSEELSNDAESNYLEAAKTSAQKLLTELVKAANPNVPDVVVDISFME